MKSENVIKRNPLFSNFYCCCLSSILVQIFLFISALKEKIVIPCKVINNNCVRTLPRGLLFFASCAVYFFMHIFSMQNDKLKFSFCILQSRCSVYVCLLSQNFTSSSQQQEEKKIKFLKTETRSTKKHKNNNYFWYAKTHSF